MRNLLEKENPQVRTSYVLTSKRGNPIVVFDTLERAQEEKRKRSLANGVEFRLVEQVITETPIN